ncbi:hypothetical protein Ancab_006820 [Ancistrocladus abbreviatus]
MENMGAQNILAYVGILFAMASYVVYATDPTQLQDFCIADNNSNLFVNGLFCKNPMDAKPDDFLFKGLNSSQHKQQIRIKCHTCTEILTVIGGTLYVGFVTSNLPNGGNRLFTKILYQGDVFVFPQGLIHFQFNIGKTPAVAIVGLSSQNPGVITIANAIFGSRPPISVDVLSKAFQLDKKVVQYLQSQFWMDNNH